MPASNNTRHEIKSADLLRAGSIILLLLHFYFYGYQAFHDWGWHTSITDRLLTNIVHTGLFSAPWKSKAFALLLLTLSLAGDKGRPTPGLKTKRAVMLAAIGLVVYFGAAACFYLNLDPCPTIISYAAICVLGYIVIMSGGSLLSRMIRTQIRPDIFNEGSEQFPQEMRCLETEHSINLPTVFTWKGRERKGWINLVNPYRHVLIAGSVGCGKSFYIVNEMLRQFIAKGFGLCLYDFKSPDLTLLAYNTWLKNKAAYPPTVTFHNVEFERPEYSWRCNPLDPEYLPDIIDAAESAHAILLNLNPGWAEKEGDFWAQSSKAFLTALIWYCRKHQDGKYCTLPHVLQLLQQPLPQLFSVLRVDSDIADLLSPFLAAYLDGVNETLNGQLASLKVSLARLSSPLIYYIMCENEFDLRINDPEAPKLVCMGNSPQRSVIYGAAISLCITTVNRLANKKGGVKSAMIYDEMPTVRLMGLAELMATARSNKVAVVCCVQNLEQLRLSYGRNQADVIANLPGNIIGGQNSGESAKQLSERIGNMVQERSSLQMNRTDTSVTQSTQLSPAVPPAKIAQLSAGEFVGVVADEPLHPISQKIFHGRRVIDQEKLTAEEDAYLPLPKVRAIRPGDVQANFERIRQEVETMVADEIKRMTQTKSLEDLVIIK